MDWAGRGSPHGGFSSGLPGGQRPQSMSVFFFIIVIVALVTCGEVLSKWMDRQAIQPPVGSGSEREIADLREQVLLLSEQVDRLTEEQRFLTRLLEERAGATPLAEHSESKEPS